MLGILIAGLVAVGITLLPDAKLADKVELQIAYAIGVPDPVSIMADATPLVTSAARSEL